jgi:hypothetical protein
MRARKGLALPRVSHSGKISLAGSRRLHSTLAMPVLFGHAVVTVAGNSLFCPPPPNKKYWQPSLAVARINARAHTHNTHTYTHTYWFIISWLSRR